MIYPSLDQNTQYVALKFWFSNNWHVLTGAMYLFFDWDFILDECLPTYVGNIF